MHYLVEKTFQKRGIDPEFITKIENPEHTPLDHISEMCDLLHDIYLKHEHIVFLSDFDMDGICSGTCGYAGLCELGFYASLYVPTTDGYGFDVSDIKSIVHTWSDTKAIITGDVGIGCMKAIRYAKSVGIRTLVTDHHIGDTESHPADVSVDPASRTSSYSNVFGRSSVCGAYVIYQILLEYARRYGTQEQIVNIQRLIVFAGIGTVSDIMPVVCENRFAIHESIRIMKWLMPSSDIIESYPSFESYVSQPLSGYHSIGESDQYKNAFHGLQALLWFFSSKLHYDRHSITTDFYGFVLAPMFNSIKRLSADMNTAFGLFFDPNHLNTYGYVEELYRLNKERKKLVSEAMDELRYIDQPFAPIIYFSDASAGILGLVAQKLMELSGMPTIVLNRTDIHKNCFHGSGRSPISYDFMDALYRCKIPKHVLSVSGHPYAFGASVTTDMDELSFAFMQILADSTDALADVNITDVDEIISRADFLIGSGDDCDVSFDPFELDAYFHEINTYQPFGNGFFRPTIAIRVTEEDMKDFQWFVSGITSAHARLSGIDGFDIMFWHGAGDIGFCQKGITALGHMDYMDYDGIFGIAFVIDRYLDGDSFEFKDRGDLDDDE